MLHSRHLGLIAATTLLAGCATGPTQIPPEELIGDQCTELRYQIIQNDNDRVVPGGQGRNPITDASLYQDYERLNCEEVITQRNAAKGKKG